MNDQKPPNEREYEPLTGLPLTPEPAGPGPGQRVRIIGLIAGLFLLIGAVAYFISGQQFTPFAIIMMACAALAAIIQSALIVWEIVRRE